MTPLNVLIITEDHSKDGPMLKPIVQAMMNGLEIPTKIAICGERFQRGALLRWEAIKPIIDAHGIAHVFVLFLRREGKTTRRKRLDQLETQANDYLKPMFGPRFFFAETIWQAPETWVLAGHDDLPEAWDWAEIREEVYPVETYYLPYAHHRAQDRAPLEGRKYLAEVAAKNYLQIRKRCPEDLGNLEDRVRGAMESISLVEAMEAMEFDD